MPLKRLSNDERRLGRLIYPERYYWRPRVRAECVCVPRPCPYVSCPYHLFLDVTSTGGIRLNFPDLEVWDMPVSCALDLAEDGEYTLEETGKLFNITQERARQIQDKALEKLSHLEECQDLLQLSLELDMTRSTGHALDSQKPKS